MKKVVSNPKKQNETSCLISNPIGFDETICLTKPYRV